ncbi:ABC transporter ATP-binding protein [Mediterraneibacter glycyrrhizinilyticus]|uniref:ABC transporter ATP-binding protein n=1 Tax=Mediterraneibacter glycyrrhizinilyticus TaxID=342942 RepID=UPI00195F9CC8|nr:ABC transporter ATP-binding protein [Mediterraneibacter glycyrrhizinilyticus]MBM6750010.1 ABC transporter ATP-binding protein [Mediterraneibacter glycyrrhizinilyticus]
MKLELDNITKNYKDKRALYNVNYIFHEGVYGLLGANGAGKSTLMRIICGIMKSTIGEVKVNGTNIMKLDEKYRDLLGYLPQDFGYYPSFTANEFMMYMASLKGLNNNYSKKKISELLHIVGLDEVKNKKIKTFSGGMKQRLGIAQAVLNDPQILILDEPTSGLDPKERIHFRNLISGFAKDKIVLLSTHIVSDIESIADQIIVLKKGEIVVNGTPNVLIQQMLGKVWECLIPESELEYASQKYCIVNQHLQSQQVLLRIISEEKPDLEMSKAISPTLEDLYMFYFRDENVR